MLSAFGCKNVSLCSHAGVNDNYMERSCRKMWRSLRQYHRSGKNVMCGDVVADVHNLRIGALLQDHAFHGCNVGTLESEVCQQCYQLMSCHLFPFPAALGSLAKPGGPYNKCMRGSTQENLDMRKEMVRIQIASRGVRNPEVLQAFIDVPREKFILPEYQAEAFGDYPLPIGYGQTISQPYIVAAMVEALEPSADKKVLDVGSGSGYQTAILSRLCKHVYAVERIEQLTHRSQRVLEELGYDNVTFSTHDGSLGWEDYAPFDGIICGAAAPAVPQAWQEQLCDGGLIVTPVGGPYIQQLVVIRKQGQKYESDYICGVRFVKLIGQQGFDSE